MQPLGPFREGEDTARPTEGAAGAIAESPLRPRGGHRCSSRWNLGAAAEAITDATTAAEGTAYG